MNRDRQQGVALVVTLIFLSVITVMAIALLGVANRGRKASQESSNRVVAQQMAEYGLQRAHGEILARILSTNNPDYMGPELTVSRNYWTDNDINGTNLIYATPQDEQAIANQWLDGRPPVFVDEDAALPGETNGFRFFLDLNRNGWFEDTWLFEVTDPDTSEIYYEYGVGDPQWVGVLRDPTRPHGPDNHFIGRYAYLIQPIGRSLDINQIHNDAKFEQVTEGWPTWQRGFRRNEGVGPWEINLAAFLADLIDPAMWDDIYTLPAQIDQIYLYQNDRTRASTGVAFDLADSLLNRRYFSDETFLANFASLFTNNPVGATSALSNDQIDYYALADVPFRGFGRTVEIGYPTDQEQAYQMLAGLGNPLPWPGAPNNTNFYSPNDYFRPRSSREPTYTNLTDYLEFWGSSPNSEGSSLFYRMLAQLGTDSIPEPEGRINLNYLSGGVADIDGVVYTPSDFISWTNETDAFINRFGGTAPDIFFELTMDRLLREEVLMNLTQAELWPRRDLTIWQQGGIPVTTNGNPTFLNTNGNVELMYSQRLHQLLQMTANIHTATRGSKEGELYPYYPVVFQPLFRVGQDGDVYIRGYTSDVATRFYDDLRTANKVKWVSLTNYNDNLVANIDYQTEPGGGRIFNNNVYFYEVPLIIGARKGFPNFNEFVMQSTVDASRKLEMRKDTPNGTILQTNLMFVMGVSNTFGVELWYPYTNGVPNNFYPRPLELYARFDVESTLRDRTEPPGMDLVRSVVSRPTLPLIPIPTNTLGGAQQISARQQFFLPPLTNQLVLAPSVLRANPKRFELLAGTNQFETDISAFNAQFQLEVKGRLVYYLFDVAPDGARHLVDAVTLNGLDMTVDVTDTLEERSPGSEDPVITDLWNPESDQDYFTIGVRNQVQISTGRWPVPEDVWRNYAGFNRASGDTVNKGIAGFRRFMGLFPSPDYPTNDLPPPSSVVQAPFSPSKKVVSTSSWQANDPLVHYTLNDLRTGTNIMDTDVVGTVQQVQLTDKNFGKINERYSPWGGRNNTDASAKNAGHRDPGLWNPDNYEFPTNKFPNVGWLGRVHRGTPWQTIYLKSDPGDMGGWFAAGGMGVTGNMIPTNDWRLLDFFTTGISPDATRGRMSINQNNLAAWSAVLAGVTVSTLEEPSPGNVFATDVIIEPAIYYPNNANRMADIVQGINVTKGNRTFFSLGDILAVPQLTLRSPFLIEPFLSPTAAGQVPELMRDIDYERIPQQILGLLKVGRPRFAVYVYAQKLVPEELSRNGNYFRMPVNYSIESEIAVRSIVRVDYDRLSLDPTDPDYDQPNFNAPRIEVESYNVLPFQ